MTGTRKGRRMLRRFIMALALAAPGAAAASEADVAAIVAQMKSHWDRPDAPLDAGPVVVADSYAVADWTQGNAGGRALLAREGKGWAVAFCSGDVLRTAAGLKGAGVPEDEAHRLERELAEAELLVAPERLAAMARFNGMIEMGDDGQ